jgi:phage terminase large subunit-like protein
MRKKKPALDPVTRYATDVVALRIVAARLVRLACQRHLNDLRDAKAKGLEWRPAAAQEALDFFPTVLVLPEETDVDEDVEVSADVMPEQGTPFVLTPFQQFIVGSLFGWFQIRVSGKTGARRVQQRFRICYVEAGKGSGKTPMGAGLLIYLLIRHGVRGAQLFCAAVTKDQAKLAFADCVKMFEASPALKALITLTGNNLAVKSTGSFIRPISAEKRGLDGKRVQGAVVDELHEHRTATVVVKLIAGIKGRPNALIFIPTNSGFDRESICWEYHEYSRKILEGTLVNETWFAFVCHLDPCDRCVAAGKQQPSDDCAECDDWKVEGPHWLKACPNLGVSVSWQYQREQVRIGTDMPSQRNWVRRLNFCQWTAAIDVWIPPEAWARCLSPAPRAQFHASLVKRECFIGIDLSELLDLSSAVLIFPRPIERPDQVRAVVDAGGHSAFGLDAIDRAIDVRAYFWMPRNTITRRSTQDNVPYDEWARDGVAGDTALIATSGDMIDQDAIVDFLVGEVSETYHVRGIGFDISGAAGVATRLKRHFGDELVTVVPQSFNFLNKPSKTLEALVVSRNLAHDGNPVMTLCMGNMAKEENPWRLIRPIKMSQRQRIDGGVALIDAIWAMQNTAAPPASVGAFVV